MVLKLNRSHARDFGLGTSVVGVEVLHVVASDLGLGKVRLTLSSNRGSYLPKLPNLQFSIMLTCRRSDSDTRLTLAHGNNDPNFVCLSLFKTSSGTSEISHCETRGPDPDRNKESGQSPKPGVNRFRACGSRSHSALPVAHSTARI